jgi:hypothetical protein
MNRNSIKIILLLGLALSVSACKQTQPIKPSGYLVNYKHLKPVDNSGQTLYFEDKQAPWQSYHSIMFSEVIIRVVPDADEEAIDQKDLDKMRNYFQRSLANSACRRLQFVNEPGEGVMLLRTAIVNIEPVNVAANIVSRGLFYVPVDFGEAAIEGELRDSMTGRHLASIVDRKISSFINPKHSYTTWGTVEDAFDSWARQLGKIMDNNLNAESAKALVVEELLEKSSNTE